MRSFLLSFGVILFIAWVTYAVVYYVKKEQSGVLNNDDMMVKLGDYWVRVGKDESIQDALLRLDSVSGIKIVFIDKYYEKRDIIKPECLTSMNFFKPPTPNSDAIEPLRQDGLYASRMAVLFYETATKEVRNGNRKAADSLREIGYIYDSTANFFFSEWRRKLDSIKLK